MAEIDQVLHRGVGRIDVVDRQRVHGGIAPLVVDEDDRDAAFGQQRHVAGADARRQHHDCVHAPLMQAPDDFQFGSGSPCESATMTE